MKITDIKPQKKRKNRFNIYADDEFVCGLSEDTIIDEALAISQEITRQEIDQLIKKDQSAKAFDSAIRFLGYRARSEKEIYDKLKSKEYDEKVIKKTISRLEEMGYLSDDEFARMWINERIGLKPKGKKMIQLELRQKGISDDTAQKQLDKLVDHKTETLMAKNALEKALKQYKTLPNQEKRQKITSYLARRGFGWDLIKKLLDKI